MTDPAPGRPDSAVPSGRAGPPDAAVSSSSAEASESGAAAVVTGSAVAVAPVVRVAPSWTEGPVTAASVLVGGPLGRHAVVGRSRFWTPLRVLLLFAVAVLAAGWLFRAPCIQQAPSPQPGANGALALDWQADRQYVAMCYSDIVTFYGSDGLSGADTRSAGAPLGGSLPYQTFWNTAGDKARHYLAYPVMAGFVLWDAARLTRHYESLSTHWPWLPTGLPEVVFFDILAFALAVCWLCVVRAVHRARPHRPWDAALVALSPVAFLHVFTGLDALAVALALAALGAFARDRPVRAGVLLALAAATKPYAALLLIPVLLLTTRRPAPSVPALPGLSEPSPRRVGRFSMASREISHGEPGMSAPARMTLSAVLTWAVVNLPVAVLFTPGWLEFWRTSVTELPGPDSIYTVLGYFTGWPHFPAGRTPWALDVVVLALLLAAVAGIVALTRTAPRPPRLASLCFLLVASALLVNKTWSPQFSLVLVPLAVLALPRWRLLATWMTVEALVWVPRMYFYLGVDHKGLPEDPFLVVVLIRDAVVVLLMALVVRTVLRPDTDPVRAFDPDDPDWPRPAAPRTGRAPDTGRSSLVLASPHGGRDRARD